MPGVTRRPAASIWGSPKIVIAIFDEGEQVLGEGIVAAPPIVQPDRVSLVASSSLVAAGNSLGYESRAHPDANIINLAHYFL